MRFGVACEATKAVSSQCKAYLGEGLSWMGGIEVRQLMWQSAMREDMA
jgi:hypothetical protein